MTVLIIDDDRDIREMLAQTLEDEGYQTTTASDGREALMQLASSPYRPCLILLDLMMPGMNGWEFRAAQLRDPRLAEIGVVVLSARTDLPNAAASMTGVEYLAKPIDFDSLMALVVQYCGAS